MKPKFTLIVAFFLALIAGAAVPISASAREHHRVHVYFYYGSQPSYYYQPAPGYTYYQPEPSYSSYQPTPRYGYYRLEGSERWRRDHRDRDWDRGRHRDWDRD